MRQILILARNSRFFIALGVLLLAGGVLGLMRSPMNDRAADEQFDLEPGESADFDSAYPGVEGRQVTDVLERQYEMFHIPELKMESLATILRDLGLELVYPDAARELKLKGLNLGGRPLGAILQEMFRPHGYGLLHQGQQITLIPIEQEIRYDALDNNPGHARRSNHFHARMRVKSGIPFDFWTDSEPAVRLHLVAQPLYGDEEVHGAPPFKLVIEVQRNLQPWFTHHLETTINQPARIEMRGMEMLTCTLTPRAIEGTEIILEVTFHHESVDSLQ